LKLLVKTQEIILVRPIQSKVLPKVELYFVLSLGTPGGRPVGFVSIGSGGLLGLSGGYGEDEKKQHYLKRKTGSHGQAFP
jgi:hypothetical protein